MAESWTSLTEFTQREFGGVDILVNNAGLYQSAPIEQTSFELLMTLINVNQVGVFLGTQSVIPVMQARGGGSIVNISSASGLSGYPGNSAYGSTKWAVHGFTLCAAKELADLGIRVNAVYPGLIDTPMIDVNPAEKVAALRSSIRMGRIGTTDDVARTVLFLCSQDASYVTGAEVLVDGGGVAP